MNSLRSNKNNKDDKQTIFTKETLGVVLILFATLIMICLITNEAIFSLPGHYVNAFFFGMFGYLAFPIVAWLIVLGVMLLTDKKINAPFKRKALFCCMLLTASLIAHVITMHADTGMGFSEYISKAYAMGEGGVLTCSGGGFIIALVAYWVTAILTSVGTYVVFGVLLVVEGYSLITSKATSKSVKGAHTFRSSFVKEEQKPEIPDGIPTLDYPVGDLAEETVTNGKQKLFVNNADDFAFKTKKDVKKDENNTGMKIEFSEGGLGVVSYGAPYSKTYDNEMQQKLEYIKTPAQINLEETLKNKNTSNTSSTYVSVSEPILAKEETDDIPMFEHDTESKMEIESGDDAESHAQNFADRFASVPEFDETASEVQDDFSVVEETTDTEIDAEIQEALENDNFEFIFEEDEEKSEPVINPTPNLTRERGRGLIFDDDKKDDAPQKPAFTSRVASDDNIGSRRSLGFDAMPKKEEVVEEKPEKVQPPINREYFRPPLDLLETYSVPVGIPPENHEERKEIIQHTLEEFHINAIPQNHIQGPAITRYEIMMPSGIPVKRVLNYSADLKMRLASKEEVRIEAPIPGKNLVGVEVANRVKVTVGLKEVLEGMQGQNIKPNALQFVLGKDLVGNSISDNLAKGPHYLVAGATGSGKSVCLNVMLVSLIMRYSPEELRIILVDPKQVEFRPYEHLPHLMMDEIITEPKKALAMLSWAQQEMERRYSVFRDCKEMVVDIDAYNSIVASDTVAKMPRIVIVIDELADLMETCKKDLESRIQAIAQKARSAGIHLVLATQRPSVNIITGTIKANLPSRIAFKVMNFTDSQTILGEQGAEKLLGNGDMLYKNSSMPSVERYQGAYISSREVNNIVSYIKEKNTAYFDDELKEFIDKSVNNDQDSTPSSSMEGEDGQEVIETNDFFLKALAHAVLSGTVSISQLQRRFQIGWTRAGGIIDKMERMGFISGNEGSKARKVLLTKEGFEERFGPMPDTY